MKTSTHKIFPKFPAFFIVVFLFLASGLHTVNATIFTSSGGTNVSPLDWNNISTWSITARTKNTTNVLPTSIDEVIILPGHAVSVSGPAVCDELDIRGQLLVTLASTDVLTANAILNDGAAGGALLLQSGKLRINTTFRLVGLAVKISGSGSALTFGGQNAVTRSSTPLPSEYIVLENSGTFIMENLGKGGSIKRQDEILFPVGTSSSYTPIVIDNKSLVTAATYKGDFGVRIIDGVFLNGYDGERMGDAVNKTWEISLLGSSPHLNGAAPTSNATIKLTWNQTDENDDFVLNNSRVGQFDPVSSGWTLVPLADISYTANQRTITQYGLFATGPTTFPRMAVMNGGITPLPVELVSFNAVKKNKEVALTWETASEKNNKGYEIQSSADGKNYEALGFVASQNGNSNSAQRYAFTHKTGDQEGLIYYRLKQIDLDGTVAFYNAKVVDLGRFTATAQAYPNPFREQFRIELETTLNGPADVVITDMTGKTVYQAQHALQKGMNNIMVALKNQPAGFYFLKAVSGNQTYTNRLMKQ